MNFREKIVNVVLQFSENDLDTVPNNLNLPSHKMKVVKKNEMCFVLWDYQTRKSDNPIWWGFTNDGILKQIEKGRKKIKKKWL